MQIQRTLLSREISLFVTEHCKKICIGRRPLKTDCYRQSKPTYINRIGL